MKPIIEKFQKTLCLPILLALSVALVACGGGSGSNPSGRSSGSASVGVSLSASSGFPAGTTFAASTASPVGTAAPATTTFDHVWVTITKLALIRATGPEFPHPNGELESVDAAAEEGNSGMPGFVTIVLPSPVVIDLLHPPTGGQVALIEGAGP